MGERVSTADRCACGGYGCHRCDWNPFPIRNPAPDDGKAAARCSEFVDTRLRTPCARADDHSGGHCLYDIDETMAKHAALVRARQTAPGDGEATCVEIAVVEVDSIGLVRGGTTHAAFLRAATNAYAAGRLAAFREIDHNDEALLSAVAYEVGQATKQQPTMNGQCRGGHGEQENRRIARAVIHTIAARAKEGT